MQYEVGDLAFVYHYGSMLLMREPDYYGDIPTGFERVCILSKPWVEHHDSWRGQPADFEFIFAGFHGKVETVPTSYLHRDKPSKVLDLYSKRVVDVE